MITKRASVFTVSQLASKAEMNVAPDCSTVINVVFTITDDHWDHSTHNVL